MRAKLLVPMVALALVSPASAESVLASAISADSEAGCLTIAGASNNVGTSRARWLFSFYPDATLLTPAGPCPEDAPHVEAPVVCALTETTDEGTWLYLAARTGNGPTWLVRALDASSGPDAFGVAEGEQTEDRCGAAEVEMHAVSAGVTLIASAST